MLRHSLSHGVAYFEAVQEGTCSIEVQTQRLCELPWRDEEASLLETDEGLACLHLHPPSHCLPSLPATPLLLSIDIFVVVKANYYFFLNFSLKSLHNFLREH